MYEEEYIASEDDDVNRKDVYAKAANNASMTQIDWMMIDKVFK